ncbi:MAG: exodeoxyribonuclease VII small subunit [Oscillospiraceae bacterium]|nr:exodeoxyribonuclease VII small subunit [Oscillospiraceae bacterium]
MATEWTFEKAMTRLEQIVSVLESGRCTLDESLKLFEEGTKLTAYCSKALKTAEQKIVKLTAVEEATPAPDELVDRQGQDMGQALSE